MWSIAVQVSLITQTIEEINNIMNTSIEFILYFRDNVWPFRGSVIVIKREEGVVHLLIFWSFWFDLLRFYECLWLQICTIFARGQSILFFAEIIFKLYFHALIQERVYLPIINLLSFISYIIIFFFKITIYLFHHINFIILMLPPGFYIPRIAIFNHMLSPDMIHFL